MVYIFGMKFKIISFSKICISIGIVSIHDRCQPKLTRKEKNKKNVCIFLLFLPGIHILGTTETIFDRCDILLKVKLI